MRRLMLLALVVLVMGFFLFPTTASAKQPKCKVVDKTASVSFDNLQAAVDAASSGATLKLKGTCYGTTTIDKDLIIEGGSNPGYGPASLDGNAEGSVLEIMSGAMVAIDGLTITNGYAGSSTADNGGGIWNAGDLELTDSTICYSTAENDGGGIFNASVGTMTLMDSTVSGNTADEVGGGIFNLGTMMLMDSTVSGNEALVGGGIFNAAILPFGGTVTLQNSTVSGNTAEEDGGGIYNDSTSGSGGTVTLQNSTVSGNTAEENGGGIYNGSLGHNGSLATVTLTDSTVSGNTAGIDGGGIYNESSGTVTLTNVTFMFNQPNDCSGVSCS